MADAPINLNRARKARAREDARRKADENAARFGRTKAEKAQDAITASKLAAHVDGHRIDGDKDTS